jgi:hypothetical protein
MFRADDEPSALEGNLKRLFLDMLGLKTVRAERQPRGRQSTPIPSVTRPSAMSNHLLVAVMKQKPFAERVSALQAHPAFCY